MYFGKGIIDCSAVFFVWVCVKLGNSKISALFVTGVLVPPLRGKGRGLLTDVQSYILDIFSIS